LEKGLSFSTFSEFINMGGHGFYVWLCYGVGLFLMLAIMLQSHIQRKSVLRDLAQRYRRQELNKEPISDLAD
jgi:heme exporter protein D